MKTANAETYVFLFTLLGRSICRPSQSHTEGVQLSQLLNHRKGVTVLKRMMSHYDVFVEASTPHGEALQVIYGKALKLDDAGSVSKMEMVQQNYSQQVTSNEKSLDASHLL